jgi:hypothetical protein
MATSPNYGWSEPDNSSLVKDGALAIRTLGNAIDTTVAAIPNPNLIAGGSFDIWQRGTGAFTTNGVYTSDRFYVYSSSSFSLSQETSIVPTGATNAARITSTAGSSYANMQFALEQSEVEKLAGKTVTFSVYLRANATYNGSTGVEIYSNTTGNTQTGGTWALVTGASTVHTPSTSAYTRVTVTGTVPTTAKGLKFYIGQQSVLASGSILYIALAKAELSSVATPFVRANETFAGELAACQRFYYRFTPVATSRIGGGYSASTTAAFVLFPYPVTMRTVPTALEQSGTATDYTVANSVVTTCSAVPIFQAANVTAGLVNFTVASGLIADQAIQARPTTAGFLGWSAEL